MLTAWADALQSWTTLGDLVLVGHRQAQLTEAALDAAHVILTGEELSWIFGGLDLSQAQRRTWWRREPRLAGG